MRIIETLHDDTEDLALAEVQPDATLAAARHVLGLVAGDLARAGFYASAQAVSALADLIAGGQSKH
jgi:hypothetical protein